MESINQTLTLEGNIVDLIAEKIYPGKLFIENGIIQKIVPCTEKYDQYIIPGFIDAHVHIESAMLRPSDFAILACPHGTIATISDPHEIANVMGIKGVEYMLEDAKSVPLAFFFGAPSCVPATGFETSGAEINSKGIEQLLKKENIIYLAEMMNFPGVIYQDEEVLKKIEIAHKLGKKIDGHAPGLRGKELKTYINAGIDTDHEAFTEEEAREKLENGMKIIIREGSAAKNFDALIPLLSEYPNDMMFCSDDKHPNDLVVGHINLLAKRAVAYGHEPIKVLKACCKNPIDHYHLPLGLLQTGDPANMVFLNNLKEFKVLKTYIAGMEVASHGKSHFSAPKAKIINNFNTNPITVNELQLKPSSNHLQYIVAQDGQLITKKGIYTIQEIGNWENELKKHDILKIVVKNRYKNSVPAIGFIQNFGLKKGAIASTVSHDSHNLISVGFDDESICEAMNALIQVKGGISVIDGEKAEVLPLPIAGLISDKSGIEVALLYEKLDQMAKGLGSELSAPFMTLSFCALLVIPHLKLSDLGLFDADTFQFTDTFKPH